MAKPKPKAKVLPKGRVLAIDDEPFFRTVYEDVLKKEGYHVRTAESGEEGLDLLHDDEYDLVITDLQMPGMDGLATTEAIRRFNPQQEVMIITGQKDVEKAILALQKGVSAYLLKPINPEEFLHTVNRLMFSQSLRSDHERLAGENHLLNAVLTTYHKCMGFLTLHDLDRLADQILDVLMDVLRGEGSILWLANEGTISFRHFAHRGLVRPATIAKTPELQGEERERFLEGEPVLGEEGRKLWIPISLGTTPLALAQTEMPVGRDSFTRRDLKNAAAVAAFAASALFNVLRLRETESRSLKAERGVAYGMAFFQDFIVKELHKARRYGRSLTLLHLKVENYQELMPHFQDREIEDGLRTMLEKLRDVLRDADVVASQAKDDYYILLPETDFWGSLMTQKRIRRALRGLTLNSLKRSTPLRLCLRGATHPGDGADFEALKKVTDVRLARQQDSAFHREPMLGAPFWNAVQQFLGTPKDYRFTGDGVQVSSRLAAFQDGGLHSRYFRMPRKQLIDVQQMFCREVAESYRARGIIYRSCANFEQGRQALFNLEALEKSATSVFLLGGEGRVQWDYQRIVPVHIDAPLFRKIDFLLYLSEDQAYALFANELQGDLVGFHTSNFYFVENMIVKLQEQYQLQTQI